MAVPASFTFIFVFSGDDIFGKLAQ